MANWQTQQHSAVKMINQRKLTARLQVFILTAAHLGYVPRMPGTAASAAMALCYLLLMFFVPQPAASIVFITLLLGSIGCGFVWARAAVEQFFHAKDPKPMVIDELAGMGISLLPLLIRSQLSTMEALSPIRHTLYVSAVFVCFRCLDIMKPGLIGRVDAHQSPQAIMLDDILAGGITALFCYLIVFL